MIRVLFVCHGNICRSPMAEFIFRDMVAKRGLGDEFFVASAATSREEIGNPVYPPAKRKLKEHGTGEAQAQRTRNRPVGEDGPPDDGQGLQRLRLPAGGGAV